MMQPPWIAFPHIQRGSIGWRMGPGEDYWSEFSDWYQGLSPTRRKLHAQEYPEPQGWSGFYARKDAYIESIGLDKRPWAFRTPGCRLKIAFMCRY